MLEQDAEAGLPPYEFKTIPQGAATTVWAGVVADPNMVGGRYCEDCGIAPVLADGAYISALWGGVRPYALDSHRADALWDRAKAMIEAAA